MNTTKNLETRLRSWTPRAPSASVEARLFGRSSQPLLAFRLNWLAPAAAALLVMGMVIQQRNSPGVSGGSDSSASIAAMIPSNQLAAAFASDAPSNAATIISGKTFEWTNERSSTSSISSLSALRVTN